MTNEVILREFIALPPEGKRVVTESDSIEEPQSWPFLLG